MAFLTPRETVALAALVNNSLISCADLSRVMTQTMGVDISAEATAALARSLVGQGMAERSANLETYRATAEGRAWIAAYADS